MRPTPFFFIGLLLFACSSPSSKTNTSPGIDTRPNLILIIADDMAWDDCGAYGHPSIKTPNLDQMAREGMRFDAAFLTASSCSPSRSSIITGRYPHQTDAEQLHWPLPPEQITFVEQLKAAGYWTGQAGKWHLGDSVKDRFDVVNEPGTAGFMLMEGQEKVQSASDGSGCDQWVATLQSRPKDRPFFLWLAALDPHRDYEANIIAEPHTPDQVRIPPYMPDAPKVREDFALYYDEISRMDDYIGQVFEELAAQGVSENTMVLFISDNGRPFPRDKTTVYDGGIKTPWIVKWPTKVQAGTVSKSLVSSIDIAPTFLTLAGLEVDPIFEGEDFSPILTAPQTEIRSHAIAEDHWHDVEDFCRAIRTQQFKYIRNFYPDLPNTPPADALRSLTFVEMRKLRDTDDLSPAQMRVFVTPRPQEELYDIVEDPYELINLAREPDYASTLEEMRAILADFQTETQDELPSRRTPDEFDRETGQPLPARVRPRASKKEMGF